MDINLVLINLEKIGFGVALFLGAYLANIGLGIWRNVKVNGQAFDLKLTAQSCAKFGVLGLSLALLTIVLTLIPDYATYVGIEIGAETMETINSLVIVGAFLTATIRYATDALSKLRSILNNTSSKEG